jgi:hypothetical protein
MDPTMQSPIRIEIPVPSGPHTYFNKTWVGRVTDGIGPRQAFESLSRHATPFQSVTSVDGGTVNIPIVGAVRQFVDPGRLTIVNTTEPGHALHPGNVHRSIVQEGDDLYVVTHGYGTGILPWANEQTAPRLWKSVDNNIRHELNPEVKSPAHAREAVRDSAAHAGVPSRLNVFEFGFPDSDAISPSVSLRSAGDAVSATAGADFVGPGIPFVSTPAGSLVAPEGSALLDSAPMNPAAPGRFSTGGRFVPRSSSPQPLYPTGALVPTSNGRVYDRQGLLDDRSGYGNSSPADDTGRFRSPVLRELQKYRQLAASAVDTAPSSAASNLGIPRGLSSVGSGAGDIMGGVFKWIGNGLIPSVEASPSKPLLQDGTAPDFLGDSDGSISDASVAASPLAKDNRRYLSRRVVGQGSAFDTGAAAVPFVPSNAGLAPDYPNSLDDRFGSSISAGGATQPAQRQQASALLGLFTGEPMRSKAVPPSIFGLPDRSGVRGGSADDRELDGPQGTGIPMLDEYIRYLNREYGT